MAERARPLSAGTVANPLAAQDTACYLRTVVQLSLRRSHERRDLKGAHGAGECEADASSKTCCPEKS